MASFENLASKELVILAELRSINSYGNMSIQQLEKIFAKSSAPKTNLEAKTKIYLQSIEEILLKSKIEI